MFDRVREINERNESNTTTGISYVQSKKEAREFLCIIVRVALVDSSEDN
jgi:hypothetical protein